MPNLKTLLKTKLDKAKKIAILAIGSELRGDDAAGLLVAEELKKISSNKNNIPGVKIFDGGTAPENLTGEIVRYKPTHLILIDSADSSQKPGTIMLINPEDAGGTSFSTHMLPLKMLVDYFTQVSGCEIFIIGIQPKTIKFGDKVSKEVQKAVKQLSKTIEEILYQKG